MQKLWMICCMFNHSYDSITVGNNKPIYMRVRAARCGYLATASQVHGWLLNVATYSQRGTWLDRITTVRATRCGYLQSVRYMAVYSQPGTWLATRCGCL